MDISPAAATSASLLIVEDDPEIRTLVTALLEGEGFQVAAAADVAEATERMAATFPDLLILDVMLPGESGLSICRRVRAASTVPILMLTARGDEIDRVLGLELGADDYLVKPFAPRELVARIRSLLRRAQMQPSAQTEDRRILTFDRFVIDLDGRDLRGVDGVPVTLTSAEFDLLATFVRRPRRVLGRDQLIDAVSGRSADPFDRTIDVLISRLRRKLAEVSPGVTLISTIRGGGYLFTQVVQPRG
ncbi:response regulator [Acidimangrovimonas sediminis]|uniref:response regulator n=1 Tax=Acidimangrovimonas sediminis TaxID=2056283 RepID=UPI000C7F8A97|nr:response regulator transcription factor [Acidimangrovimonas sediminis]